LRSGYELPRGANMRRGYARGKEKGRGGDQSSIGGGEEINTFTAPSKKKGDGGGEP